MANIRVTLTCAVNIDVGDVDAAFKDCALIREDTFVAEEDSYFMIEPYAVVANYHADGSIEVWMPNASPAHQGQGAVQCATDCRFPR